VLHKSGHWNIQTAWADQQPDHHRSVSVIYSRQCSILVSTQTASWPWSTTLPLYANASHVYTNCVNCEWSGHRWPWKQQKHWCMHSSASDLITVTVCCMKPAIVCWQSCRLFRTQQRASLLEPGSSTTSLQFCVIFAGFQSGNVSVSSWLW